MDHINDLTAQLRLCSGIIYPANPNATRGSATKLSSSGSKLVYANSRTIVVSSCIILLNSYIKRSVRSVTCRSDPGKNIVYTGHIQPTTVARISPSGYYCASADTSGTVRIWDIVGEDRILKLEKKAFGGTINDLAWDGESKRIIAVGEGRDKFGSVFMFDTGSSAGEITGHARAVNAVSVRSQRPFRAVTASDDTQLGFFHGAPYKYEKTMRNHTNFVQDVRYAPSGDLFVSVGSDRNIVLYDGKTGDVVSELGDKIHSGTIFATSWAPDSAQFSTSSADKTVKIFDAASQKLVSSWTVGTDLSDQQCGNTWMGEHEIVSLSLGGDMNIFDSRSGGKPVRILYGPTKGVTSGAVDSSGSLFAGSFDGRIVSLTANGTVEPVVGPGHTNQVVGIASCQSTSKLYSVAYDDTFREFSGARFSNTSLSTLGQPKGIAAGDNSVFFVATLSSIEAISEGKKLSHLSVSYTPSSIAVHGSQVAVGAEDHKVYLYDWNGSKLTPASGNLASNRSVVSALAFSPNGKLLAAGDSSGVLMLYDVIEAKVVTSRWSGHTARINSLSFHPAGKHVVSGSLDTNVYVWSVDRPGKNVLISNAGMGGVNTAQWIGETKVASAGADASIRTWDIVLPG
ncbi:putative actin interacting protein 1 [Serendipita vermifera]|nr:putative actin interacting protein 1 [Serendipita vermifera]